MVVFGRRLILRPVRMCRILISLSLLIVGSFEAPTKKMAVPTALPPLNWNCKVKEKSHACSHAHYLHRLFDPFWNFIVSADRGDFQAARSLFKWGSMSWSSYPLSKFSSSKTQVRTKWSSKHCLKCLFQELGEDDQRHTKDGHSSSIQWAHEKTRL